MKSIDNTLTGSFGSQGGNVMKLFRVETRHYDNGKIRIYGPYVIDGTLLDLPLIMETRKHYDFYIDTFESLEDALQFKDECRDLG